MSGKVVEPNNNFDPNIFEFINKIFYPDLYFSIKKKKKEQSLPDDDDEFYIQMGNFFEVNAVEVGEEKNSIIKIVGIFNGPIHIIPFTFGIYGYRSPKEKNNDFTIHVVEGGPGIMYIIWDEKNKKWMKRKQNFSAMGNESEIDDVRILSVNGTFDNERGEKLFYSTFWSSLKRCDDPADADGSVARSEAAALNSVAYHANLAADAAASDNTLTDRYATYAADNAASLSNSRNDATRILAASLVDLLAAPRKADTLRQAASLAASAAASGAAAAPGAPGADMTLPMRDQTAGKTKKSKSKKSSKSRNTRKHLNIRR